MTLLPDQLSPGTCPAAWASLGFHSTVLHGGEDNPHECTLDSHPTEVPHACRCGARERFAA